VDIRDNLQSAINEAESHRGSYIIAAYSSRDQSTTEMCEKMAESLENHISYLTNCLNSLEQ